MYEIREDRVVTHDGKTADDSMRKHYARVESDGGELRIELADYDPTVGTVRIECAMSNGDVGFHVAELLAAFSDLGRLAGLDSPESPAISERNERVAQVVERVCAELESDHNPVRESLATDLRAVVLSLAGPQVS